MSSIVNSQGKITKDPRLYAIVLRLNAIRPGTVFADHGDQARAGLLRFIQQSDPSLAHKFHDGNIQKPYTVSLLQGGKRGKNRALNFGMGDTADWRFTLMCEPAIESFLRSCLLNREPPHVRVGSVKFAVTDSFASRTGHPDSGHVTISELTERWCSEVDRLPRQISLDFRSPTTFSLGMDVETGVHRWKALPDARIVFSTLRKRWAMLGGVDPGDRFDIWVEKNVEVEPLSLATHSVIIGRRPVVGFVGQVRFWLRGNTFWLQQLHILADLAFWTGVGYQTTRGMGQVRRNLTSLLTQ